MRTEQIQEALALAQPIAHNQTTSDVSPAIVIQYVPAIGGADTVGKVKVTTQGLRFKVDDTTPSGANAIGNSSGWILDATYTNMGQVLDQINGYAAWRAYLVCSRRGDASDSLLSTAEATCTGANGKTIFWDTDSIALCGIAISGEKFVNNGLNGHVKDADSVCINTMLYARVTMVSDGTLKFYSSSQAADTLLGPTFACGSASQVEIGEENPSIGYIAAKMGERLLVLVDSATAGNGTPTEFHVVGKTAVLKNDRIVTEDNY